MNYASEDLINEHEGILLGLKILEKMVHLIRANKHFEINNLKEMINFFKLFTDKCHHGKEEGMLFPEMEKAGIPKENGPIGQMLNEHAEGRKYMSQMSDLLQNALVSTDFIEPALNYINLLRIHIEKENKVLFPLGDKKISIDVQKKLSEKFEKFEEDIMGKGTHGKLHDLLHTFRIKYIENE